ncbi:MAG: hypothetical protein IT202_03790 [Fimbriimonadaceae bacterium]|nr:hypothetical protein [Fimbriimonadaceae bacterium]
MSVGTAPGAWNVAREFFTRSAVVGLWAATALAQASIQFTPHPDTVSAPYYFSGTNSRASFYAHVVYPTLHIARAQLVLIKGSEETIVIDQTIPISGQPPKWIYLSEISLYCMFDSTHYFPGDIVRVEMRIYADGQWWTDHYDVIVKNRILLAQHPDPGIFGEPALVASDTIGPTYERPTLFGDWSPAAFCSGMASTNAIYYNGHGTPNSIKAGLVIDGLPTRVLPYGDPTPVFGSVEYDRIAQIGSGVPPFNSTQQPGINLAYLESCRSGVTNNFIRFCYPYMNGYGFWLEDQCVLAYNTVVWLNEYESKAQTLYTSLVAGNVVTKARKDLVDHDPPYHCDSPPRYMDYDDLARYGDHNTRFKSVYTATDSDPVGWYLPYYPR